MSYLITRRCARRQFLLRPSSTVNSVFLFVLAVAARRFGIQVHTFCVLSNHWHAVVTDPEAQLPDFVKYLNSLTARALNASMGLWDNLFAGSSSYSAVTLVSPQDVVDKAAYVLANPVTAGLVRRGKDWPGLWSGVERIGGGPISAKRPKIFFRPDGPTPDIADFELTCPPGFESAAAFRDQLAVALVFPVWPIGWPSAARPHDSRSGAPKRPKIFFRPDGPTPDIADFELTFTDGAFFPYTARANRKAQMVSRRRSEDGLVNWRMVQGVGGRW